MGSGLTASCCLPCPYSQWRYSDRKLATLFTSVLKTDQREVLISSPDFESRLDIVGWCAIPVFAIIFLFLLTFAILPKEATGRHYLTTVPAIGFLLLPVSGLMSTSVDFFD